MTIPTPELLVLLKRVHSLYVQGLEVWARTDVDRPMMMDDCGGRCKMLVSPAAWRTFLKSLYEDHVEIAHRHGKSPWVHSDGYILEIMRDLIELGVDAPPLLSRSDR